MRIAALLSIVAAAPLLLGAADPLRLAPATPWEVNYAENSCRLSRVFGTGDDTVYLSFESEVPGAIDMVAVGRPLRSGSFDVPARFLPLQVKPLQGETAQSSNGPGVLWSRVPLLPDDIIEREEKKAKTERPRLGVRPPPLDLTEIAQRRAAQLAFARQITGIEIVARRGRPVILQVSAFGSAIETFEKCNRDSLRQWGVDPNVDDKIVRPAWPTNLTRWFSADDYPPAMVRSGDQSDVKLRLLVNAAGQPTKCTAVSHFKQKSFNDVVCAGVMRRARFQPAELADGTKVPSYYYNHVLFRLP